jgi:hypothetical protein
MRLNLVSAVNHISESVRLLAILAYLISFLVDVLRSELALKGLVANSLAPWVNTLDTVGSHAII